MTRKKWIVALFVYLLTLLLLEIFVGAHGLCYLASLKRKVAELSYAVEIKSVEVSSLEEREKRLRNGEGMKDAAFRLGYQTEGEQVFFFDAPKPMEVTSYSWEEGKEGFVSLPFWVNSLIALVFAAASVVVFSTVGKRRNWYD